MGHYLAFDFGAESGRALLGSLAGGKLAVEELHRFPNTPVRVLGGAVLGYAAALARDPARHRGRGARPQALARRHRHRHLGRGLRADRLRRATLREPAPLSRSAQRGRRWRRPSPSCRASEVFGYTGIQFMQINTLYPGVRGQAATARPRWPSAQAAAAHAGPVQLLAHRRGEERSHHRQHHRSSSIPRP